MTPCAEKEERRGEPLNLREVNVPPTISSKVGAVLSRFVAPVKPSSSAKAESERKQEEADAFQRFSKQKEQKKESEDEKKGLENPRVIKASSEETSQEALDSEVSKRIQGLEDEAAFAEVRELLQKNSSLMKELAGSSAYQSASRKQKKSAKFRKGTVLDKKAS